MALRATALLDERRELRRAELRSEGMLAAVREGHGSRFLDVWRPETFLRRVRSTFGRPS